MESDDALGWVELWVNRTLDIANRASEVDGLIGLQWRTQEVMAQFSALAQRGWNATLTSHEFWVDFCASNFGVEVADEAAAIFESVDGDSKSVDGRALPLFTECCPGAIKSPDSRPWSQVCWGTSAPGTCAVHVGTCCTLVTCTLQCVAHGTSTLHHS
jgi:hypothetical protein